MNAWLTIFFQKQWFFSLKFLERQECARSNGVTLWSCPYRDTVDPPPRTNYPWYSLYKILHFLYKQVAQNNVKVALKLLTPLRLREVRGNNSFENILKYLSYEDNFFLAQKPFTYLEDDYMTNREFFRAFWKKFWPQKKKGLSEISSPTFVSFLRSSHSALFLEYNPIGVPYAPNCFTSVKI